MVHPFRAHPAYCVQVPVNWLVLKADSMFPEDVGAKRAFAKEGAAAEKTNELLENALNASKEFFKQRGYDPRKPEAVKAKLGYALDTYECAAYLLTGVMHLPLLSQPDAMVYGKRINNIIGASGSVGKQLIKLRKRGKATAPQVMALLNAPSTLSLAPPPRQHVAPVEPPAPLAPPAQPPPPAGTRASSAELYDKVFGSMEAAKAAATAERYENSMHLLAQIREYEKELEEGDDASELWIDYDEDGVEIQRIQYKRMLKQLSEAFPELELQVSQLLEGVCADEHNSCACPCGTGRLPRWPWVAAMPGKSFCDCSESSYHMCRARSDWIPPSLPYKVTYQVRAGTAGLIGPDSFCAPPGPSRSSTDASVRRLSTCRGRRARGLVHACIYRIFRDCARL